MPPLFATDDGGHAPLGVDVVTSDLEPMPAVVFYRAADQGVCGEKSTSSSDDKSPPAAGAKPAAAGGIAPSTQPEKTFKTKDGKTLPPADELSKKEGDPKAGTSVFRDVKGVNCIKCHQIGDDGGMIGPPLTAIGNKLSKAQLYEAILYPSAAIEMGYETWVVKSKDGDVLSGLKAEDTDDHVTIKDSDGKYHDVPRDKIEKMVKQTVSLMPENLNEAMTEKDFLNLIEYLTTLKG